MTDGDDTEGQGQPDETLPLTHQPYSRKPQVPPVSPSGSAWPSYEPPSPTTPLPTGELPSGPPTYGQPQYGQPQYGQQPPYQPGYPPAPGVPAGYPVYGRPMGYAQSHGGATTSMVLGIIALGSLALAPFCCVTIPGVLTAPFALGTGISARRQIARHPGVYSNAGHATAGFVMGIIGSVLAVLMVVGIIVLFDAISSDLTPVDNG